MTMSLIIFTELMTMTSSFVKLMVKPSLYRHRTHVATPRLRQAHDDASFQFFTTLTMLSLC